MNTGIINQKAWEIAAQSIMEKNNKFETYSNKQIRGFFELSKSNNFEQDIETHINKYRPQPSQKGNPRQIRVQLTQMRELNKKVGDSIKEFCKPLGSADRARFFQYLIWNIKIIENRTQEPEKIQFIMECEDIENPQEIIKQLTSIPRKKNNRDNQYHRGR